MDAKAAAQAGKKPAAGGPAWSRSWSASSGMLSARDLDAEARKRLAELPDPPRLVSFGKAVRTRRQAGGHAESSHRVCTALHLANIAIRMGRRIHYDPVNERIVGDEEANRMVDIPMRAPWHL